MSIPVELPDLQAKTAEYTWAYLLTVRPDATPHLVSLSPQWDGDALLMSVSTGTARNSTTGAVVTLCYPPLDHDGYSLIVDGLATAVDGTDAVPDGKHLIRFAPRGAVLHRSAAPGFANSATGCANDCLPVDDRTNQTVADTE
ncbi:MAG: pyridoxamine 5'-phosphate oxidase family protein [Ilumatobacter sp.]|uniref:pyridoxamine 5'-phosphate oxidase family protein n=1 Tax=Ilumatobacter sp. TaxID=1967498 RepID=UPI00329A5E46